MKKLTILSLVTILSLCAVACEKEGKKVVSVDITENKIETVDNTEDTDDIEVATSEDTVDEPKQEEVDSIRENEGLNDSIKVSKNLFDYEIALDGVKIKLPCEYSELTELGWSLNFDSISESIKDKALELGPMESSFSFLRLCNENYPNTEMRVQFMNTSDTKLPIEECKVVGIVISSLKGVRLSDTYPEIKVAGNISFGTPTEDVKNSIKWKEVEEYVYTDSYGNEFKAYSFTAKDSKNELSTVNIRSYDGCGVHFIKLSIHPYALRQ